MIVAAASAWSQCTFRIKERNPIHRTLFSMACAGPDGAGGRAGLHAGSAARPGAVRPLADAAQAARRRGDDLFRLSTRCRSRPRSRCRRGSRSSTSGTRTSCGARRATSSAPALRQLAASVIDSRRLLAARCSRRRRCYLTYRTYKVYLGRIEDEQRHVQRGVGPAPGDHRSARAGDRREGSDRADATSAACRSTRPALARALGMSRERNPGREDGRAAARHRQARRARAHPVEARAADAGGVPEDPHSPAGRRRDHQRRAVPVSGGAADPQPSRAVGRQGLSRRAARAKRSRSARASSRSSTTSTR